MTNLQFIISVLISLIGFGVTIISLNRKISSEFKKKYHEKRIEHLDELVKDMFDMIEESMNNLTNIDNFFMKFDKISKEIMLYGSQETINLYVEYRQGIYYIIENPEQRNKLRELAFLILLLSEIKYDATNEHIFPESWYRLKITDYSNPETRNEIKEENNKIVNELKLNKKFLIM